MKDRKIESQGAQNQIRMIRNSIESIKEVQGERTPDKRVTKKYPELIEKLGAKIH